jgi:hypothetical protein
MRPLLLGDVDLHNCRVDETVLFDISMLASHVDAFFLSFADGTNNMLPSAIYVHRSMQNISSTEKSRETRAAVRWQDEMKLIKASPRMPADR